MADNSGDNIHSINGDEQEEVELVVPEPDEQHYAQPLDLLVNAADLNALGRFTGESPIMAKMDHDDGQGEHMCHVGVSSIHMRTDPDGTGWVEIGSLKATILAQSLALSDSMKPEVTGVLRLLQRCHKATADHREFLSSVLGWASLREWQQNEEGGIQAGIIRSKEDLDKFLEQQFGVPTKYEPGMPADPFDGKQGPGQYL